MSQFSRAALADIAEAQAKRNLVWSPGSEAEKFKQKFWPVFGKGKWAWCAAFVTWCCEQVGLHMPIKSTAPWGYTYAFVEAWQQWAIWMGFYIDHVKGDAPQRGDIVIFDWNQISEDQKDTDYEDHIGVFLYKEGNLYVCAEGNTGNQTAIRKRDSKQIQGFVRIPAGWDFGAQPVEKLPGGEQPVSQLLRMGSSGPAVETLQVLLKAVAKRLGRTDIDPGLIDGRFGERTKAAVLVFQVTFGLEVDGIAGAITQGKLESVAKEGEAPVVPPPGTEPVPMTGSLEWYDYWWARAQVLAGEPYDHRNEYVRTKLLTGAARYHAVEDATGVPFDLVAGIHGLESSFSFSKHLHNGDPLEARTTHVPAGRPKDGSPPFSWEESAIDAMKFDGLAGRDNWTRAKKLQFAEKFNGVGYLKMYDKGKKNVMSAYLWSGTSVYKGGKYVADGVWSDTAVSAQVGMATMFKLTGTV